MTDLERYLNFELRARGIPTKEVEILARVDRGPLQRPTQPVGLTFEDDARLVLLTDSWHSGELVDNFPFVELTKHLKQRRKR